MPLIWLLIFAVSTSLICFGLYSQGFSGPLFFDDLPNIVENPYLRFDGTQVDDWRVALISLDSGLFLRPISALSYALNFQLAGDFSPDSLKATNALLHLAIGGCLFGLFNALLKAQIFRAYFQNTSHHNYIALTAAAIWLLHPLHVSTVLYAVQRMAQIATFFVVIGLWVFVSYRLRWANRGATVGEVVSVFLWLAIIFLFALLSKENGALLPWLIIAIEVFVFRGQWQRCSQVWLQRAAVVTLILPFVALFLLATLQPDFLLSRYGGRDFSLEERLFTQGRMLWQYLSWLLVPDIFEMGFHHDDIQISKGWFAPWTTLYAVLGWIGAVVGGWVLRKRFPLLILSIYFYLMAHSMESSVWPLELAFEHRNYLPSIFMCLTVAVGIYRSSQKLEWMPFPLAAGIVLLVLTVLLAVRTDAWSSETSLARWNVTNHPESPRANFFYGNALLKVFENSQSGLTDDERAAYAVKFREHFVHMHELAPNDMAALVMLHQIDSNYFSRLPGRVDWFDELERAARERKLRSSDRAALGALVRFSNSQEGLQEKPRVVSLLDDLLLRYPKHTYLYDLKFTLLSSSQPFDALEIIAMLNEGNKIQPRSVTLYAPLVLLQQGRDVGAAYESVGHWLKRDSLRRDMPIIRRFFESTSPELIE